jgi:hypothetical protein
MIDKKAKLVDISRATKPEIKREKEVEIVSASDLKPEPIVWLWNGFLAHGKPPVLRVLQELVKLL